MNVSTYTSDTFSRSFLIFNDMYDKSPESSLTPTARYPKSLRANATAEKPGIPLLDKETDLKIKAVVFYIDVILGVGESCH